MELSFGQVERVLANVQDIRDDRRSAFANRLKNYQKAGFPEGTNTGRGRAASYDIGHLLQLGLALELNQLGLNPERAAAVVLSDMHAVAMALSHAASQGTPDGKFELPFFLFFDPANLRDLMHETDEDPAVRSFFYGGLGQLKENLETWAVSGLPRLALVNVSSLLWRTASFLAAQIECEPSYLYKEVEAWASPLIHNEPHHGSN